MGFACISHVSGSVVFYDAHELFAATQAVLGAGGKQVLLLS